MAAPYSQRLHRPAAFLIPLLILPMALPPPAPAERVPDYDSPYSPILTDRQVYSWTDKVRITILAPSWNSDRHLIDSIGGDPDHSVRISTRTASLENYRLTEDDVNNGIFTGEVTLTGFLHDVDGDGDPDTNPRTAGGGPTGGLLEAGRDSALTVSFEFADGVVVTESVPISWNAGTVGFSRDAYEIGQEASVRVVDTDMNLNPDRIDRLRLAVYSDSDVAGLDVDAAETGPDSGVFESAISLSSRGGSGGDRLFALPGDTIRARYEDRTPPVPHGVSDELGVSARARVVPDAAEAPPAHRARIGGISFADAPGSSAGGPVAGRQIQIVGGLSNNLQHAQPFTYLFQIRDAAGSVIDISWVSGVLPPSGTSDVSRSWIPAIPGTYSVESFAWGSISAMDPISERREDLVLVG